MVFKKLQKPAIYRSLKMDWLFGIVFVQKYIGHGKKKVLQVNPGGVLFAYIPAMFLGLHLLYEEMKLDSTLYGELHHLANLLSRIACKLSYCKRAPPSRQSPLQNCV
jgi:hypothetical protein